jgi:hypothetical protein
MGYEEYLSRLQRWILNKAYCGIIEVGSDKPQEYRRGDSLRPVHLLRIEVLQHYFKIPLRTQQNELPTQMARYRHFDEFTHCPGTPLLHRSLSLITVVGATVILLVTHFLLR